MNRPQQGESDDRASDSSTSSVAICLIGLVAGWTASGGFGLLGHPLRHAITWVALAGVLLTIHPWRRRWSFAVVLFGFLLAVAMSSVRTASVNILAVAVALSTVAMTRTGRNRTVICLAAEAVTLLAVFQFVRTSIPIAWQSADAVGELLGRFTGAITGRPLWVGASFAGLDFLLVSMYLAVMAPLRCGSVSSRSRTIARHPVTLGLAAIMVGHAVYLACLSLAPTILDRLPEPVHQSRVDAYYHPPTTTMADVVREVIPWNMMSLGMVIHVAIACGILVSASKAAAERPVEHQQRTPGRRHRRAARLESGIRWPAVLARLAVILSAVVMSLCVAPSSKTASLQGKKIVFNEKGFLNWLKPKHGNYGRLSIGMYGMLPTFLESFGARPLISAELSEEDLRDADALVLIFPDAPWQDGQLDRIWNFVRRGGCLLVMGEHTTREADGRNRFNDVLAPTAMRVRFDSATFAVGGWLQSYETLWHSVSAGIKDTENDFGVVIGASVSARPPARPLLAGRWGWADPGDEASDAAMMGNGRYDAGEKLGDVMLAAEQPFGNGKIIVFGDTSTLSNGINIACHRFTSRLMAYAADVDAKPLATWRQLLAVALAALFVVIVASGIEPELLAVAGIVLSATLLICTGRTRAANELIPDGNLLSEQRIAYIDASHLEAYSRESWREDGIMGLCLTLMRNGYLPLTLPEISAALARSRIIDFGCSLTRMESTRTRSR